MIFTSFNFLLFFPLVGIVFYLTPVRWRWVTLLATSFFFYLNVKPVFTVLLAGVVCSTYLFTRLISNTDDESRRKLYMVSNIILVLLPLVFFKYFSVVNNSLDVFLESVGLRWPLPEIKYILPVGISFYTFMAIGYTIDVYNEDLAVERNPGYVALFISFFPLILSGPIERAGNMLPQFRNPRPLNYDNITAGLKMMLWGYFMKLVVADRIGFYVDAVYNNIPQHNGTSILFASVLYPFQIYADLGGYSLLAIGTAKVLGFEVMQNFKRPFFATSMSDFWRRWHISLISWLTDYIYTPLSFSFRKYKIWGIVIALMITFLISGIWHGAALTYIAWGLLQGTFLSVEALTNRKRLIAEKSFNLRNRTWYTFLGCSIVFILFSASQIFGRSPNISDALTAYRKIFTQLGTLFIDKTTLAYAFIGLTVVLVKDFFDEFYPNKIYLFENKIIAVRFISYLGIIFMILLFGVLNSNQFIYFQF